MNFLSIIEAKRSGAEVAPHQIYQLVKEYTAGQIPDYQMAAWLMAVYFQGLSYEETRALTLAMRDSGRVLHFPEDPRPLVDKHSTGGIGDKVSLPLAPLLTALGLRVPMISGRGLGFTGGTLDKLESIPGFRALLPIDRIIENVGRVGCVICGQTEEMVPADKKMYALRDVTGTIPSFPLITASIISKKLAENLQCLLLDVKFGAGAFVEKLEGARKLARAMVELGNDCGVQTRALLTNMNQPLGQAAGNWLEVRESVACLEGNGPADLTDLVVSCAAHLLVMTKKFGELNAAKEAASASLKSGAALRKWEEMLGVQGANLAAYHKKLSSDPSAPVVKEVAAPKAGFIIRCNARAIGELVRDLGGGRLFKEAKIDLEVGVDRLLKPGERVEVNGILGRIHARNEVDAEKALARLRDAFTLGDEPVPTEPLLAEVIELQ
jgi:pyrimidine-nucleoside phosphorylase